MFFKITRESNPELDKKIREILAKAEEKRIEDEQLLDSIPYKRTGRYYGSSGWSGFSINRIYSGLEFEEGQDVNKKAWIKKDGMYFPNKRTISGKEIERKLNRTGDYFRSDIADLMFGDMCGRGSHTCPRIWKGDDCLVCFIFEKDLKFLNVELEEITMSEASSLAGVKFEF